MPATSELFKRYKDGISVFVETGTFLGDGVRRALDAGFARIYSLEIDGKLATRNQEYFANTGCVTVVQGDSSRDLARVLSGVHERVVFWLDAHYSSNPIAGFNPEQICPILSELEHVEAHLRSHPRIRRHVVMVDDVRLFRSTENPMDGNFHLPFEAVVDKLMGIDPQYRIAYEDGAQPGDILVAF